MTMTPERWEKDHAQGTFDGVKDIEQQARYEVIGDAIKGARTVLDVGCNIGLLRPYVDGAYTGIDHCASFIEEARRRWGGTLIGTFLVADANTHDVGRFDAVVLNEVLYYLDSPEAALRHYAGMVVRGGVLVVSIYDKAGSFLRSSPNERALKATRRFAGRNLESEQVVEQNGKKWAVLVIHC